MQCFPLLECPSMNSLWRVCVAVGAIPGLITVYLRTFLPETPRFLVHVVQLRLLGLPRRSWARAPPKPHRSEAEKKVDTGPAATHPGELAPAAADSPPE